DFGITPAGHLAAGYFVNDDAFSIAHDVVLVALKKLVRAERLIDVMNDGNVFHVVKRVSLELTGIAQPLLKPLHPRFGQRDGSLFFIDLVVGLVELRNVAVDRVVEFGPVIERAGNDQRRARLIDQNRVHFVDDGIDVTPLDHILQPVLHVVAQIVEPKFVIGPVRDVAIISLLALLILKPMHDDADGKTKEIVDLSHPLRVAFGEIVVDRDDMHAASRDRVEIDRKSCDQRLAFAGLHFRNLALVENHAADQLNVEMTLTERALRGLADRSEGRNQQLIERGACSDLLLEFLGAGLQRVVGKSLELLFELIDLANPGQIAADTPLVGGSKQLAGNGADHSGAPNVGRDLYHAANGRICLRHSGMRHFSGKFDVKHAGG